MMATTPLVWPDPPERVVVWHRGRPVSLFALLAAAERLAADLPDRSHVLNACTTHYGFLVALLAALLRGQITVLPNDRTPRVASRLQRRYPQLYCLNDAPSALDGFETRTVSPEIPDNSPPGDVPSLAADQAAVIAFTSGSTGEPEPNEKSFRIIATTAQLIAQRFELDRGPPSAIVATVPGQHMYGLETAVALPLWTNAAVHSLRPFYPANIAAALREVPAPRMLVTTPIHLRGLLASSTDLPSLSAVISATAPLSPETARAVERRFDTTLLEIYGFSEAGTVATRRTAAGSAWHTCEGLTLRREKTTCFVEAAHYPAAIPFSDNIELLAPDRFELIGRASDTINVAGKRASLNGLNAILNDIEGVIDGTFFHADEEDESKVARLVAFVVAPETSPIAIREALRGNIDPVFMPRQIHRVAALPRLESGKLPRGALVELAERVRATKE